MDVTSLLNTTASARHLPQNGVTHRAATPPPEESTIVYDNSDTTPSPRTTASKRVPATTPPHGSRIPWDAGGYSLALALESKCSSMTGKPNLPSESLGEGGSPRSPWHKMSESHSSRSSHASSSSFWSQTHSRLSSISTVNGLQTIPDVSTLEIGTKPDLEQPGNCRPRDLRPTPLSDLPFINAQTQHESPISPSDAVMMIRSHVGAPTNPTHSSRHLLHVQDLSKHKRTISAPDFAPAEANRGPDALRTSMRPGTPCSDSNDSAPTDSLVVSANCSGTEGKAASESADEEIKCMYVENCDTNSSLRKAISHIFGRNKLCTRMIPAHVWVHYCRKHYQRSRYRNAQEYAKLQAELVQRQVMRIQAWSDCNKASGQGSVVSNWSISMRKREQNRVQEKSKKRSLTGESEEDDDCADRAVANGTAVPDWLREKCGEGYSTSEIEAITSRLKENVDNGTLAQIPDIEILPNISADSAEDGRSRSMSKRKPSTLVAHRRAQSVTIRVCPPVNDYPDRSAIHAIPFVRTSEAGEMFPARKRHRAGTASYNGFCYTTQDLVPPGQVHRPAPVTPLSYGLPHRPAVTSVLDNYCTSPYDENSPRHSGGYTPQRPALAVQQARLPFARPLSPPAGMDRSRRMSHGRSHSELSGFTYHSNEFTFRSPPPSHASPFTDRHRLASSYGYDATHLSPLEAHHQAPRSACEQGQGIHRLPPWTSQSSGGQVASDPAFFTLHRHARNLSTPVAFRESPPLGGSPYEQHACYQHA